MLKSPNIHLVPLRGLVSSGSGEARTGDIRKSPSCHLDAAGCSEGPAQHLLGLADGLHPLHHLLLLRLQVVTRVLIHAGNTRVKLLGQSPLELDVEGQDDEEDEPHAVDEDVEDLKG